MTLIPRPGGNQLPAPQPHEGRPRLWGPAAAYDVPGNGAAHSVAASLGVTSHGSDVQGRLRGWAEPPRVHSTRLWFPRLASRTDSFITF